MYNVQRTATIRAMSSCRLWKMDRFIYLDLLLRDAKAQRQRLVDFVKEQKVFSGLTAEQAAGVAELLQPVVLPAAAEYAGTQWSALAGSGTEAAAGATSAATADAIFFVERGELTLHRDGDSDATTLKRGDAFGAAETHLAALLSRLGHTTNAELHLAEPSELGALKVAAPAVAPARLVACGASELLELLGAAEIVRAASVGGEAAAAAAAAGEAGAMAGARRLPLLSSLSPDEFAAAQAALSPARFVTGDVLCRAGEPSPAVYLLVAGSCTMAAHTLHVGSWFGEGGALFHKPSSAAIVATEPVVVLSARGSQLEQLPAPLLSALRNAHPEGRSDGAVAAVKAAAEEEESLKQSLSQVRGVTQLKEVRELGRGAFAVVMLVTFGWGPDSGKRFALKVVDRHKVEAEEQQAHILAEKEAMLALSHPYVLRLHRTFKDYHSLYFLLEYAPGGELQHLLDKQGGKLTEKAPHAPRAAAPRRPAPPHPARPPRTQQLSPVALRRCASTLRRWCSPSTICTHTTLSTATSSRQICSLTRAASSR